MCDGARSWGFHPTHVAEPSSALMSHALLAVQSLSDGFLTVDRDNRVLYMNPAAEALTGWTLGEALGKPSGIIFRVLNAVTGEVNWQPMSPVANADRHFVLLPESVLICKDLSEIPIQDTVNPIHNLQGEVSGAVILFRDLRKHQALLRQLLERTHRDALTGLCDRTVLQEELTRWRTPEGVATGPVLLYLDLDRFKTINDTWGHLAGDQVLQTTAKRLRATVPESAVVCRLGGDEFVVLLDRTASLGQAHACVADLLRELNKPIAFADLLIEVTISVGVAVGGQDGSSHPALLRSADSAMYRAKQAGGNRAEWGDEPIQTLEEPSSRA